MAQTDLQIALLRGGLNLSVLKHDSIMTQNKMIRVFILLVFNFFIREVNQIAIWVLISVWVYWIDTLCMVEMYAIISRV